MSDIPRIGAADPVLPQPPVAEDAGNVRILRAVTRLDIPVERVLLGAQRAQLTRCFVIGEDADGELWFASTKADGGSILWDFERAKALLLSAGGIGD